MYAFSSSCLDMPLVANGTTHLIYLATITSEVRCQMIIFLDIKLNSTREKFISSSKSLVCPCLDITLKNHMSWLNTVLNSFGQIATIVQSVVWLTRVSLKCIYICVSNHSIYDVHYPINCLWFYLKIRES